MDKKQTLVCPVEFKNVEGKENYVTGIASVFGNVDDGGDIVEKGAFAKTIAERIPKKLIKFVDSHIWDCAHTLGTVEVAKETDKGLYFEASLSVAPSVQDIKLKMLEGHINKLSFGYDVVKDAWEKVPGGQCSVRRIKEIKLYEISVCPLPMNEETTILSVKEMDKKVVEETDTEIKVRIENPDKFVDDSFKTISIDKAKGISAIIGKYKSDPDGSTHIQSYRFKKDKDWTKEKAVEWVDEHEKVLNSFGIKEQDLMFEPLTIVEPSDNSLATANTYNMKARAIGTKLALQKKKIKT